MMDTGKRYYIVDMSGNFYKNCGKQGLTQVRNSNEADLFTLREANERIGHGRKAHFYNIIEAEDATGSEDSKTVSIGDTDTPTLFDGLNNDWEGMLEKLCYMSSHLTDYQANLSRMLSDVDKEICDIRHCIEFEDLTDAEMLRVSKLLKEKLQHRREIKDEQDRTGMLQSTFLDEAFDIKVHQGLELMERMKHRMYTPRKLPELFERAS